MGRRAMFHLAFTFSILFKLAIGDGVCTSSLSNLQIQNPYPMICEYQELTSGLKVIAMQETTSDGVMFAYGVKTGYYYDPPSLPGMAHLIEHLLFLGSTAYPIESEFDDFISKNGGSDNAFTDAEVTVYFGSFFSGGLKGKDLTKEGIHRAMDMIFSPTLSQESYEKEVHAVHSEHIKNLPSKSRTIYELSKALFDDSSPAKKFSTGNLESLHDYPSKSGIDMRDALLAFHDTYYCPSNGSVVVQTPFPPSMVLQWLEDLSSTYSVRNQKCKKITDQMEMPLSASQGNFLLVPIKFAWTPSISFVWNLPLSLYPHASWSPSRFFSYLSMWGGEGGLEDSLRQSGYALSVSFDEWSSPSLSQLFLTIELSDEGEKQIKNIMNLVNKHFIAWKQYFTTVQGVEQIKQWFSIVDKVDEEEIKKEDVSNGFDPSQIAVNLLYSTDLQDILLRAGGAMKDRVNIEVLNQIFQFCSVKTANIIFISSKADEFNKEYNAGNLQYVQLKGIESGQKDKYNLPYFDVDFVWYQLTVTNGEESLVDTGLPAPNNVFFLEVETGKIESQIRHLHDISSEKMTLTKESDFLHRGGKGDKMSLEDVDLAIVANALPDSSQAGAVGDSSLETSAIDKVTIPSLPGECMESDTEKQISVMLSNRQEDSLCNSTNNYSPCILMHTEGLVLYYRGLYDKDASPKVEIRLSIRLDPTILNDILNHVMLRVHSEIVYQMLNKTVIEKGYECFTDFSIVFESGYFDIRISVLRSKFYQATELFFQTFKINLNDTSILSQYEAQFALAITQLIQNDANDAALSSHEYALRLLNWLEKPFAVSNNEIYDVLLGGIGNGNGLNFNSYLDRVKKSIEKSAIDILIVGAITKEDSTRFGIRAGEVLRDQTMLIAETTYPLLSLLKPMRPLEIRVKNKIKGDKDNALVMSYQMGVTDPSILAVMEMIMNYISAPAFAELRTRLQMGYIVGSLARRVGAVSELLFVIQGSKYSPDYMEMAVERLLSILRYRFDLLLDSEIEAMRNAAIQRFAVNDSSLQEQIDHWWGNILNNNLCFNESMQSISFLYEAKGLRRLMKDTFRSLTEPSPNRVKFSIKVFADDTTTDIQVNDKDIKENIKQELEQDKTQEKVESDETVVNDTKSSIFSFPTISGLFYTFSGQDESAEEDKRNNLLQYNDEGKIPGDEYLAQPFIRLEQAQEEFKNVISSSIEQTKKVMQSINNFSKDDFKEKAIVDEESGAILVTKLTQTDQQSVVTSDIDKDNNGIPDAFEMPIIAPASLYDSQYHIDNSKSTSHVVTVDTVNGMGENKRHNAVNLHQMHAVVQAERNLMNISYEFIKNHEARTYEDSVRRSASARSASTPLYERKHQASSLTKKQKAKSLQQQANDQKLGELFLQNLNATYSLKEIPSQKNETAEVVVNSNGGFDLTYSISATMSKEMIKARAEYMDSLNSLNSVSIVDTQAINSQKSYKNTTKDSIKIKDDITVPQETDPLTSVNPEEDVPTGDSSTQTDIPSLEGLASVMMPQNVKKVMPLSSLSPHELAPVAIFDTTLEIKNQLYLINDQYSPNNICDFKSENLFYGESNPSTSAVQLFAKHKISTVQKK